MPNVVEVQVWSLGCSGVRRIPRSACRGSNVVRRRQGVSRRCLQGSEYTRQVRAFCGRSSSPFLCRHGTFLSEIAPALCSFPLWNAVGTKPAHSLTGKGVGWPRRKTAGAAAATVERADRPAEAIEASRKQYGSGRVFFDIIPRHGVILRPRRHTRRQYSTTGVRHEYTCIFF